MFGRARSFFEENGGYIFLSVLINRTFSSFRNRMLSNKLKASQFQVGPRAHLRGLSSMSIGMDFMAGEGLWLEAVTRYGEDRFTPRLIIGNHVRISHWSHISCANSVTIGDHVLMGSKVIVVDHNHGLFGNNATPPTIPPAQRPLERDRFVKIGNNVWLGDGAVVCPGVTIGEGSVVGANAVVTTDVPPFTLVAGVPARAIRRYDSNKGSWIRL